MLKFFFNKESWVVYAMESIGIVLLIILIAKWWPSGKTAPQQIAFFLFILLYIFIRACTIIIWYDSNGKNTIIPPKIDLKIRSRDTRYEIRDTKYEGIQLHFKKALVPTSYIIAIFSALLLMGTPTFLLYFADFLLIVIAHVNAILIYFHFRDREPLPVNFFTHNKPSIDAAS